MDGADKVGFPNPRRGPSAHAFPARVAVLTAVTVALAATGALGCVSSSSSGDRDRIHDLARTGALPPMDDDEVDLETPKDVKKLLEEPLTAETAVKIALLNNRGLRAELREVGVARGRLLQAGLLPNPVVEAELLPERNTELELRVEYDITGALLAPMKSLAAGPELEAARLRAAGEVLDLGYRVRAAFYAHQAALRRLSLAERTRDTFAAGYAGAKAMFKAGNIRALDLASQGAAHGKAEVLVGEAELEVLDSREALQRLLGLRGDNTAWKVAEPILAAVPEGEPSLDGLEKRAVEASFDLRATRQRLEGLSRTADATRVEGWVPDVAVDVHGLNGNPDEEGGATRDRSWRFGAGVSVGVPLFDRGQGNATALDAEALALLERYVGMAVDVRSAAREARNRVLSAHGRAKRYQETIVPAQAEVVEQMLLQYNAMQVGVFDLLQAHREQLDAEVAYTNTLREYWTAVAALEALLAGRRVGADDGPRGATSTATSTSAGAGGH